MSDIAAAIFESPVPKIIATPVLEIIADVKEISAGYQPAEHWIHLILVGAAIMVGCVLPFTGGEYADWIHNLMEAFGLVGGEKFVASFITSAWIISYPTSFVVNIGNQLGRHCVFGDREYYLTARQCLAIADELNASATELRIDSLKKNSVEVRAMFNSCLKNYRKPPSSFAARKEDFQEILDKFLHGAATEAIRLYLHQQKLIKKSNEEFRKEFDQINSINDQNEEPDQQEDTLQQLPRPAEVTSLQIMQRQPQLRIDPISTQPSPTAATTTMQVIIAPNQPSQQQVLPLEAVRSTSQLSTASKTSQGSRRLQPALMDRRGSTNSTASIAQAVAVDALTARMEKLAKALGEPARKYTVEHPGETVEARQRLLQEAVALRGEVLRLHPSARDKTAEQQAGIIETHYKQISLIKASAIAEHIKQDKELLARLTASTALPARNVLPLQAATNSAMPGLAAAGERAQTTGATPTTSAKATA